MTLCAGLYNKLERESYETCLDAFVSVKTERPSDTNILSFIVCSFARLTFTNVSARHCVRVEEERLHYFMAFFIIIAWHTLSVFVCSRGLQSSILSRSHGVC
jgi:hypothetical protein